MSRTQEYPRTITVEANGLRGFLVIDSTINGMSAGGVRLKPGLSAGELGQLARVMTLKFGFLGLPCGGAKAGLSAVENLTPEKRASSFTAFGRALAPMIRRWEFRPGQDLGTTPEDIGHMCRGAEVKHFEPRDLSLGAAFTGLSVAVASAEAARFQSLRSDGLSFAVTGFGRVGSAAAREMLLQGNRLVGLSTIKGALYNPRGLDLALISKLQREFSDDVVDAYPDADKMDAERLWEIEVDILCPCGDSFAINEANADSIQAKIVSPGANLPMTGAAEKILQERGIVCLPDFVSNCGGVLGPTMLSTGLPGEYVREFIKRRLAQKVSEFLSTSAQNKIPLGEFTRLEAERDFFRIRAEAEHYRWLVGLARLGNHLYQKQLIPRRLSAACTKRYFEKRILVAKRLVNRNGEPD